MHYLYIIRCSDDSLYVGITEDIEKRLIAHNEGRGAIFTTTRRPVKLVYQEQCTSIQAARRRERQIKGWRRAKKENLIQRGHPLKD